MRNVKPEQKNVLESALNCQGIDIRSLSGLETAMRYVKAGRFISAVKLVEHLNSELTREQAKMIVNSFGYRKEFKWPEELNLPLRCL